MALVALTAVGLAGCLEGVFTDPECTPTVVQADWAQQGLYSLFPEPGVHGDYNVSLQRGEGHQVEDPQWGTVMLTAVERMSALDSNDTRALMRLEWDGHLVATMPADVDVAKVRAELALFLDQTTAAPAHLTLSWIDQILGHDDGPAVAADRIAATDTDDGLLEYARTLDGPFRFDALYEEVLEAAGLEERPDPWLEGHVEIDGWRFDFPVETVNATNQEEAGRFLTVDARDRASFHWQPPAGTGKDATLAGLQRTLSDLGLEHRPDGDVLYHLRTC